jgi:peroxiredoxin|tara:strand:- start:1125 stop:1604 length:480 start_codon:yes stop_codon:yes gene_type:complete
MKINVNDCFPEVTFHQIINGDPKTINSSELFNKKKVILVSVPGAFTPTCTNEHLPGYIDNFEKFKNKGVDEIFFVSVNDPFVMDAWIKSYSNSKINYVADSNSELLNSSGLEMDLSVIGLGKRLSRFAMFIDNGLIKMIFDEKGGGLEKSKAENVLENL